MTMGGGVKVKYRTILASELYRDGLRHVPFALPSRKKSIPVFSGIKPRLPAPGQALHQLSYRCLYRNECEGKQLMFVLHEMFLKAHFFNGHE